MGGLADSATRMRNQTIMREPRVLASMAGTKIEDKALRLLRAFERAGRPVGRVTVDGRKIEIVFAETPTLDEFERINMRHDKT